jgi:glycosyltransferase involved in cell wall biosynthesis
MGVPSVAFAIPPVLEIESGTGAIILVPPFDPALFAQALRPLVDSPADRARIGAIGRKQVFDRFMVGRNMASVMTEIKNLVGDWSRSATPYPQVINSQEIQTRSALNDR